jgi:hypothetical protein
MSQKRKIVIAGSVAQRPGNGGHAWVFLQYLLGFRRLGFDVLFLDRIEPDMCVDFEGKPCDFERSFNHGYFTSVMRQFGLEDSYALLFDRGGRGSRVIGRDRSEVLRHVAEAELILNVMGFFDDPEILAVARRRVFLDIDPGFPQMWKQLGLSDIFAGHDDHVTIGQNIGKPGCDVPTCGIDWITTPPPVVLEHWPAFRTREGSAITGIASWRGPFGPVEYNGKTYGLRVHEFRKFVALPQRAGGVFEVAMDIHPAETNDLALLREYGWKLINPQLVARDPLPYRLYIQSSAAEFMVAKNMYVATRGGWFSDRTICYLASGKPALVQDTGLAELYPCGEGLITFSTLDEAVAGVESIRRDYPKHAAAARRIAEEYFDSDEVLTNLLAKLGVAA